MLGLFFLSTLPLPALAAATSTDDLQDRLGDCNWQVSYRGRQYDLTPLTREALSRPIENDIRFAIQRVPEANERLESMTSKQRNARAHTLLASIFLGGFLLAKLLEGSQENKDQKNDYRVAAYASGGFFVAATLFSWRSTVESKRELVNAVEAFNERSPNKILPASEGAPAGASE